MSLLDLKLFGGGVICFIPNLVALVAKNPHAKAGDARDIGSIPELGRSSGVGNGHPLQYSCLENPHGQRSLVGYSPRGCKESDTAEHTHYQSTDTKSSIIPAAAAKSLQSCPTHRAFPPYKSVAE